MRKQSTRDAVTVKTAAIASTDIEPITATTAIVPATLPTTTIIPIVDVPSEYISPENDDETLDDIVKELRAPIWALLRDQNLAGVFALLAAYTPRAEAAYLRYQTVSAVIHRDES